MDENAISKFNKSFTRSEPNLNCRRVSVTEFFQQPGNGHQLIRQYSFKELRGNPADCTRFGDQFLASVFPSFNNGRFQDDCIFKHPENFVKQSVPSITYDENFDLTEDKFEEHNCSPMDIDQSDVSIKEDNSFKKLKIKSESMEENEKEVQIRESEPTKIIYKKQISKNRISIIHIFLGICFSVAAAFLFFNSTVSVPDYSIIDIEEDLRLHVFNQNHIVDKLVYNIKKILSLTEFRKLLILVGSTGVGKSYVLNRLRTKYTNHLFISLNYQLDKEVIEGKKNISFPSQCFILSLDDLKVEHMSVVGTYIKSLSHSCMLVIPVFNIQETSEDLNHSVRYDHFKQIAQYFDSKFVTSDTLLFNIMNRKHLESWLRIVIERRGLDVNIHRSFIQSLLETHDVDSYGFKGIIPKINLLG